MLFEKIERVEKLIGELKKEFAEIEEAVEDMKHHYTRNACYDYAHEDIDYDKIIDSAVKIVSKEK